jgi:hypothetical protein
MSLAGAADAAPREGSRPILVPASLSVRREGGRMKFLSAIAVALVALALAPLAAANTPGCVTRSEYRSVHSGYSIDRVHRIFDTDGRKIGGAKGGGFASQVRSYRTCRPHSSVVIQFDRSRGTIWRVTAKSAVWVG